MLNRKFLFTCGWVSVAVFVIFTLFSYRNNLGSDGPLTLGFPRIFFHKVHGMNVITGETGMSSSLSTRKLLWDIAFAVVAGVLLVALRSGIRRLRRSQQ